MIGEISSAHYAQILKINEHFVHWLSPLDMDELHYVLSKARYARQINNGRGVLIGYGHNADYPYYPEHENMNWLSQRFDRYFYIDRIIIDENVSGHGLGRRLYEDLEKFARATGYPRLTCEVNTLPDNPGSHRFHERMGFRACGDQIFEPNIKAVRYYEKPLL